MHLFQKGNDIRRYAEEVKLMKAKSRKSAKSVERKLLYKRCCVSIYISEGRGIRKMYINK